MFGLSFSRLAAFTFLLLALTSCQAGEPTSDPRPTAAAGRINSSPLQDQEAAPPRVGQPMATTESAAITARQLPDLGLAPELDNEVWLNSDGPLSLASLRGRVVLLEFWTFG